MRRAAVIALCLALSACSVTLYSRQWGPDCAAIATRYLENRDDETARRAFVRAGCYLEDSPAYGN